MTPADLSAVLRAMRWARDSGWRMGTWTGRWVSPDRLMRIDWDDDEVMVSTRANERGVWSMPAGYRAESPTQAVDVLVAYGILPAVLSSAYADGMREGIAAGANAVGWALTGHAYERDDTPTGGPLPDGVDGWSPTGRAVRHG